MSTILNTLIVVVLLFGVFYFLKNYGKKKAKVVKMEMDDTENFY